MACVRLQPILPAPAVQPLGWKGMLLIAFIGFRLPERVAYACRECGMRLASDAECISVGGRPIRAAFVNPDGVTCEILTLASVGNLARATVSTEDNTWFEGYAWSPVACVTCEAHLGWRYEASDASATPPDFYGGYSRTI